MNRRKSWSRQAVQESVATAQRTEASEVTREAMRPGEFVASRAIVHYIRAGWSLNNRYYGADLLRTEGVAAAVSGTQLYIDHATDDEVQARPAGTVTRIAAVQDGPAWWDEEAQAVAANVRLFRPWRETITDARDTIGLSVRAWVTSEAGEVDGRHGDIVTSIEAYRSVDFVTVPAAGGRIVGVMESATPQQRDEARNAGAWLEAGVHSDFTMRADRMYGEGYLTRVERIALSSAIGDALAAFTTRIEAEAPQLFERDPYREPEAVATSAEETAAPNQKGSTVTTPSTGPAAAAPADTGQLAAEAITANARAAQAEAENARLAGAHSRADESARIAAEAVARAERAEAESRTMRANESARSEVARQLTGLGATVPAGLIGLMQPRVESAVIGRVPMVSEGENVGQVNAEGLAAAVTTAIEAERVYAARCAEAYGAGNVSDLGGATESAGGVSDEALTKAMEALMLDQGMPANVAARAAKGV